MSGFGKVRSAGQSAPLYHKLLLGTDKRFGSSFVSQRLNLHGNGGASLGRNHTIVRVNRVTARVSGEHLERHILLGRGVACAELGLRHLRVRTLNNEKDTSLGLDIAQPLS